MVFHAVKREGKGAHMVNSVLRATVLSLMIGPNRRDTPHVLPRDLQRWHEAHVDAEAVRVACWSDAQTVESSRAFGKHKPLLLQSFEADYSCCQRTLPAELMLD